MRAKIVFVLLLLLVATFIAVRWSRDPVPHDAVVEPPAAGADHRGEGP
jgi:hypothetical protein